MGFNTEQDVIYLQKHKGISLQKQKQVLYIDIYSI